MAEFSGMRNGVKDPASFAGSHVISADVSRRSRPRAFFVPRGHDQKILVNASGSGRDDGFAVGQVAVDVFLQVDGAVIAEGLDDLAAFGVQTQDVVLHRREDTFTVPIFPVRHATAGAGAASLRAIV